MCRLIAIINKNQSGIVKDALLEFRKLADCGCVPTGSSKGHKDGWGLAVFADKKFKVKKRPRDAFTDQEFLNFINKVEADKPLIIVGHLRKASIGKQSFNNTHPFAYKNFVFCHNGSINGQLPLKPKFFRLLKGETDSERFFFYCLQTIEEDKSKTPLEINKSIVKALSLVKKNFDHTALNLILSDGNCVWAAREVNLSNEKVKKLGLINYYTLYRGVSKKDGVVIICSEKLPFKNFKWLSIDNHKVIHS